MNPAHASACVYLIHKGCNFTLSLHITVPYLLCNIRQIIQLTFKVILRYYRSVLQGKLLPSCSQEFDSFLIKRYVENAKAHIFIRGLVGALQGYLISTYLQWTGATGRLYWC